MASSIVDFASLQTAIAAWLHRSDLTSVIPDFIANAEAIMSAKLKSRSMENRATLTATAGNAYVALPTDMVEARRLVFTSSDPNYTLRYVTPDELTKLYPFASQQGIPQEWTVIGPNAQFGPVPSSAYTFELTYLQRIPALSGSNTTNWVLTSNPNVYLYGALAEACNYIRDPDSAATFAQMFATGMEAINAIDWYSGSTMQVRSA